MNFLSVSDKIKLQYMAIKNLSYITGASKLSPPITMWRLTKRCNLLCKHCSHHLNRDKIEKDKLIEIANKIASSGTLVVLISGGEPLIVPNIKEILTILKKAGKIVMLNTNGFNLEQFNDFILKNEIDYVAVSFDGHTEEIHDFIRGKQNSFNNALESIKHLKMNRREGKPYLLVRGVVMKDNYLSINEYADFFEDIVDEVKFQPIHDYEGYDEVVDKNMMFSSESNELEESFSNEMKKLMQKPQFNNYYYKHFQKFIFDTKSMEEVSLNHCLPIWFVFMTVLEDGSCKTCTKEIGNIFEDELDNIWNNKKRLEFLTALSHYGKCNMPCWLTCTGAAQSWQGKLIKTALKQKKLPQHVKLDFENHPNYLGISSGEQVPFDN